MIGCIIAGFFIGLDSSLAQEKTVILQAMEKHAFGSLPKRLFPMTRKFTIIAVITSFFVSLVLILVFNRDIEWLTKTARDEQAIHAAQLSVSYEIFFIIAEHTNHMIDGLRHRFELISSLKLAKEVQQNLLPDHSPCLDNYDISGTSIYCDETGGDYYDYFLLPDDKLGIVVADVCGHGIGAAMLMTSVRAFLTSAIPDYQDPAQILNGINRHITHDCSKNGRFTTMFFLEIEAKTRKLQWVRAGHEPALIFHAVSETFSHLDGSGLVLGVDDSFVLENSTASSYQTGDIIIIGTDGINETRNNKDEPFGTPRLEQIIRDKAGLSARELLETIVEEVISFRGDLPQEDDITLVIIKAT